MKTVLDSVILNRIQLESTSEYVQVFCTELLGDTTFDTHYYFTSDQFNVLLNELALRSFELNFDAMDTFRLSEEEEISLLELDNETIILPSYCMPQQSLAMIA